MSERMLIGYLEDGIHSGIDKYLLRVRAAAEEVGVGVDFLTSRKDEKMEKILNASGERLIEIPSLKHPIAHYRQTCRAIRAGGYTAVYLNISEPLNCFGAAAAKRCGVGRIIVHSHSSGIDRASRLSRMIRGMLNAICKPILARCATEYVACSVTAGAWLFPKKVLNSPRFRVIYNAVDTDSFAFDPAARQAVRAEFGISPTAHVIGTVGHFCYQKNNFFLLDSFARFAKTDPDAVLFAVGDGEDRAVFSARAAEFGLSDRVILPGVRRDISACMSAFDVFALPSRFEGYPVVALEAQANGLPCLLSDRITREIEMSDRVSFLPISDSFAWSRAMSDAVRQPRGGEGIAPHLAELTDRNRADRALKEFLVSHG